MSLDDQINKIYKELEAKDAEIARLREKLNIIADWDRAPITGEHREHLLDIIRSICDCARDALRTTTHTP